MRRDQLRSQSVFIREFGKVFGGEDFGVDAAGGVLDHGVVFVAAQDDADGVGFAFKGQVLLGVV